jgi:hypothetical protein
LPKDTTAKQVLGHFNRLYDLSQPDWKFKVRAMCTVNVSVVPCVVRGGGGRRARVCGWEPWWPPRTLAMPTPAVFTCVVLM